MLLCQRLDFDFVLSKRWASTFGIGGPARRGIGPMNVVWHYSFLSFFIFYFYFSTQVVGRRSKLI